MSKFRFFSAGPLQLGSAVSFSKEQTHHAISVLRLAENAEIEVTNGQGLLAKAQIIQISKKGMIASVLQVESLPCPFKVELCFGISKGKALDFIIHKAAEIGILSFQPLETQFSLKTKEWNPDRWQRVLEEGIKQSQSLFVPQLKAPLTLEAWMKKRDAPLFFCDEKVRDIKKTVDISAPKVDLLIGSEGGFSDRERVFIQELSPHFLSLGSNRLRTETATLVACVLVKKVLGEL